MMHVALTAVVGGICALLVRELAMAPTEPVRLSLALQCTKHLEAQGVCVDAKLTGCLQEQLYGPGVVMSVGSHVGWGMLPPVVLLVQCWSPVQGSWQQHAHSQ